MQSVIARLCVDLKFRRAFLNEPEPTLASYDLTREEIDSIRALDMEAVQEYAASLVAKKIGVIRKWLPLSFAYLEANLPPDKVRQILRGYSLDNIRDTEEIGGDWVRGEFERLCGYFRERIAEGEITARPFPELLEFEATTFSMELDPEVSKSASEFAEANSRREVELTEEFQSGFAPALGRHACVRGFDSDVAELVARIQGGQPAMEPEPEPEPGPTWVLFFKIPNSVKAETHAINLPLKELLGMCNGKIAVRDVISAIADKHAADAGSTADELGDDCLQILEQLYHYGAVTFVPVGEATSCAA
jgi:hypothetical protein